MNDALLSGSLHFSAVGAPSLITLWGKTKGNMQVKGMSAMTTYPLYLNVRNPNVKSIKDFTDKDKIAVPSVKVSTQAIMLQMEAAKVFGEANYDKLDPLTVTLSHPDGMAALMSNTRRRRCAFHDVAVSRAGNEDPGRAHADDLLRDPRRARDRAGASWRSTKFREANPKTYNAFYDALNEAIDAINRDKRAAAKVTSSRRKTRRTRSTTLRDDQCPDYAYTLTPQKVGKTADFMYKIGSIKNKPASWKDMFFPEVHNLPGN